MTTEGTQRSNEQWLADLRAEGPVGDAAQRELHQLVTGAVRRAVSGDASLDTTLEDLAQVAVVHVLQNLERFEGRSKFTTWAYAVAVRAAYSELRRATYRDAGEELSEANTAGLETGDTAPARWAEQSEIVEVMHRVINEELTERQRTAILAELEGTAQDELLATLGVNRNALYKLTHDARRKLKQGLLGAGICDDQVREAFDL